MNCYHLNYDLSISRFILISDLQCSELLYPIPPTWWSRFYEYKWASLFVEKDDVCLDAGCGIINHFKFYLATVCKEAHGCDIDINIENKALLSTILKRELSQLHFDAIQPALDSLILCNSDVSNLPYADNYFNKIYGISLLGNIDANIIEKTFLEFNRVLKDDGLLVLTFDHPTVNLNSLIPIIEATGFKFAFEPDFNIYPSVLQTHLYPGLTCFRALLIKSNELIIQSAEIIP